MVGCHETKLTSRDFVIYTIPRLNTVPGLRNKSLIAEEVQVEVGRAMPASAPLQRKPGLERDRPDPQLSSSRRCGPNVTDLSANWIAACFAARPFPTERWFVDNAGKIAKSPR